MQLWIGVNLCRVAPGFLEQVWTREQADLVNDFTTAADVIVGAMDVGEILHGDD